MLNHLLNKYYNQKIKKFYQIKFINILLKKIEIINI